MLMRLTIALGALFMLAACGAGDPTNLTGTTPDSCALARPDFGGPATAADRAVFAYDASAPLNLMKKVDSTTKNGVEFSTISYDSPDGGSVSGIMIQQLG